MPLQQAIATAFQTKLNSGAVSTSVGDRVYDTQAPVRAQLPLVIWGTNDMAPWDVAARQNVKMTLTVQIWVGRSDDMAANKARDIADDVYSVLHGKTLTVTGAAGVTIGCLDRGTLTVIDDAILHESTWQVIGTKT